jgi:hypothetical protein
MFSALYNLRLPKNMAIFPADVIKSLDDHNYPKDTDLYKAIQSLPEIGVGEDYPQACMIELLKAFPLPEVKPEAKSSKSAQNG